MRVFTYEYVLDMTYSGYVVLEDDGRFRFAEQWVDVAGAGGNGVEGSWRREGEVIVLSPQTVSWPTRTWKVGQEVKALERGDTLDLGGGLTLTVPPDLEETVPLRNDGAEPLMVRLEPPGVSHTLAPGQTARVIARGPGGLGGLQVYHNHEDNEIVVYGWSGSQATFVSESHTTPPTAAEPTSKPPPPTPAPPHARLPAPAANSLPRSRPVGPPDPAPDGALRFARFEPRAPSPELAARIHRWVDELSERGLPEWIVQLGVANGAIPLASTQIYIWLLRPDGQVLCVDHESFARRAEPEILIKWAYPAIAKGARVYPGIEELLPADMAGLRECERCGGEGWVEAEPPAKGTEACFWCDGMGWRFAAEPSRDSGSRPMKL